MVSGRRSTRLLDNDNCVRGAELPVMGETISFASFSFLAGGTTFVPRTSDIYIKPSVLLFVFVSVAARPPMYMLQDFWGMTHPLRALDAVV